MKILVINGSASRNSSNERLIEVLRRISEPYFDVSVLADLKALPHFDPEQSTDDPPPAVMHMRKEIEQSDGVIICTPEYVFSIPSGLKNLIEWCVSTTIFTDKPLGIITASAHGAKGHEELQLIMRTVMARFTTETTLLIQGIKGKVDSEGRLADETTLRNLQRFTEGLARLLANR